MTVDRCTVALQRGEDGVHRLDLVSSTFQNPMCEAHHLRHCETTRRKFDAREFD